MESSILIVAGETSGDTHAAKLVKALREAAREGAFSFFGSAGPAMRAAGVEAVVEADHLSVVGLPEIASSLPMFISAFRKLKKAAATRKPAVAVLVDFPDFNLKLARSLKTMEVPVVYYISPQLWAWRKYRLAAIKRDVDLMLTILPFEEGWYRQHGYDRVHYVGSPVVREVHASTDRQQFRERVGIGVDDRLIAFLPGSREREISRILPVLLEAVPLIRRVDEGVRFIIAAPAERHRRLINEIMAGFKMDLPITVGETYDVLNASDVAAVTSGTATLEAAILGTPMAVVYRTSAINYRLLEPLIDVPHYALINLIAGKRLAKEMIQHEFTAEALSEELLRLLDPTVNKEMRADLRAATETLGHGGASMRAAEAILKLLAGDRSVFGNGDVPIKPSVGKC